MIIEKIIIHNYRNFKNFEIKLNNFNIIIGENNIGKTNLLNAIGLVFSSDISFYQKRKLEINDFNYERIIEFKKQVICEDQFDKINFPEVKIETYLSGFNKDQEAIVGDWFTGTWDKDITKNIAKITYSYSLFRLTEIKEWFDKTKQKLNKLNKITSDNKIEGDTLEKIKIDAIDFPINEYKYSIYGGDNSIKRIEHYWLGFFRMELLDALRDSKNELLASRGNTLLYKILTYKTENKIDEIKELLIELKSAFNKNPTFEDIKKEIKKFLLKISLENDSSEIGFEFSEVDASELLKRISLIYGINPINIERNGLGRNNLLYISLLLSQLTKNAHKKEVFFRLIGIEEPEAHLHPHLQIHLSKNIIDEVDEEKQIIITSHSPHIINQLPLENTIILFKDNIKDEVKPYYLFNTNTDQKTIRYLRKFLDATKSTMFFARKLILVEGISEQILIPILFQLKNNKTLEQKGISIINVNGIAFKHFLEIIKQGYFIKCLVLTDSDTGKKTENRGKELQEEYKDIGLIDIKITAESTFEKEIITSNHDNEYKDILLNVLIETKPKNGKLFKTNTADKPIDTENYFKEIENYKTEFAMNLADNIKENKIFNIPNYITTGFNFIET